MRGTATRCLCHREVVVARFQPWLDPGDGDIEPTPSCRKLLQGTLQENNGTNQEKARRGSREPGNPMREKDRGRGGPRAVVTRQPRRAPRPRRRCRRRRAGETGPGGERWFSGAFGIHESRSVGRTRCAFRSTGGKIVFGGKETVSKKKRKGNYRKIMKRRHSHRSYWHISEQYLNGRYNRNSDESLNQK